MIFSISLKLLLIVNTAFTPVETLRIEQLIKFKFKNESSINLGDCGQTGCIRIDADKLLIRGNQPGNRYIEINIDKPAGPGEYTISSANRIELCRGRSNENKTYRSSYYTCQGCNASYPAGKIIITKLDGPGGYVEGSFKTSLSEVGVWKEQEPIEGTFKAYRER